MPGERSPDAKAPSPQPEGAEAPHPRHVSGVLPKVTNEDGPNEPDLDLSPLQQRRIETLFTQLATLDLYDLLGVPRGADKKAVKRAYFERTTELHPDRFFRKRLGSFKPKMEAVFARMTDAHNLLCSSERRAAYDEALRAQRAGEIEAMLATAAAEMIGGEGTSREHTSFDSTIVVESSSEWPPPVRTASRPAMSAVDAQTDAQARREALARRLLGGRKPSVPAMPARSVPPKKST